MNDLPHQIKRSFYRHPLCLLPALIMVLLSGCGQEQDPSPQGTGQISNLNQPPSPTGDPTAMEISIQLDYTLRHAAYYTGSCDGSGAVALDNDHFAVVNDETSQLLVYARQAPGAPVQKISLHKALDLKKGEEADLEAMARIEDRIYVLGSHSRDREGKKEKERRKLLAVRFKSTTTDPQLTPIGEAYEDLMDDLTDHAAFDSLHLKEATKKSGDDPEGFNLEGLCAGRNGCLWLCFRGPRVNDKALLIPLNNPKDVTAGARARFGDHVLLNLDGRSIRGVDNIQGHIAIIADDDFKGRSPAIYLWDESQPTATQLSIPDLNTFDPESIILYPDTGLQELQILSDDGGRRLLSKDCKDEPNPILKRFRSATYTWRGN